MKYLSFLIILFSINSFSADYKSAVRLKEGDVISAEVFNDILDRIELTLKPITISDLVGTWSVRQYFCLFTLFEQGLCDVNGRWTHEGIEEELFWYRDDTLTITDNGDGTFSWTSSKYQILYPSNHDNNATYDAGNITHNHCHISSAKIMACKLNPLNNTTNINGSYTAVAFMNVKRTSPDQLVLYYGPDNNNFNHLVLNKQSIAPNPPTNFTATLQSGTTPNVTFSWTASEGGADSYTIKSKDSATGTFADLQTEITNIGSFSDSLTSGTRWYRVFAVDSNGTSIGSNVVSVTK